MDEEAMLNAMMGGADGQAEKGVVDGQSEKMDVPLRPEEKKRLDWREELYLAPLTTVGNLVSSGPFWGHVVRRYHTMGTP
jgi:tRNA-dihydrouridine synthase 3